MRVRAEPTDIRKIKQGTSVMSLHNFSVYVGEREGNSFSLDFFAYFFCQEKK